MSPFVKKPIEPDRILSEVWTYSYSNTTRFLENNRILITNKDGVKLAISHG